MGYRSEVAIKCKQKAFNMLMDTCKNVDFKPHKVYRDGNYFILHWDWVKWHEEYDEIAAIENTLDMLDELQDPNNYNDTGYGYKFIRVGEEDGDADTRENDWDIEFWMVRKIDIPEGLEEIK